MNLTADAKHERERVIQGMLGARTLAETQQAREMLLAWLVAHPDDPSIRDGGEVLYHATEFANEREATAAAMGLAEPERRSRENIFVAAERAHSLEEVRQARQNLLLWQWEHPEDKPNLADLMQHLELQETLALLLAEAVVAPDAASPEAPSEQQENDFATASSRPALAAVS